MDDVMFSVRMLAAYMRMSIEKLAEHCEIDAYHLQQVSSGRVKMSADDIVKLSNGTGIPVTRIAR